MKLKSSNNQAGPKPAGVHKRNQEQHIGSDEPSPLVNTPDQTSEVTSQTTAHRPGAFTPHNTVQPYTTGSTPIPLTEENLLTHDQNEAHLWANRVDDDVRVHHQRRSDRFEATMKSLGVEVSKDITKKVIKRYEGMMPTDRFIAEMDEGKETRESTAKNGLEHGYKP